MNAIVVKNLTKKYGDHVAVDDLSFRVRKGEVFGLLGANGAGKSSTIECILGTRKKDHGEVSILEMNPIKERRKPQSYENLLTDFGIADKKKTLVKDLSGGERQRLFIVLALIPNPELVFLDELTTGLDARARRDVWNILLKLKKQGLSILLTSHYMDEVEALCDEILILKKGKTVFHGTVEEAKNQSGKSQFEDAYLWFTDEEDSYESI